MMAPLLLSLIHKQSIVDHNADDIVLSSLFTGVHGNYLKPSIVAAGLDPNDLPESDPSKMSFGSGGYEQVQCAENCSAV